jgi:hypothetical protein
MKEEELKNKLHKYIDKASGEELEELLSFVGDEQEEYVVANKYNHWEDKEFVKEIDRRVEDFETGKDKGIPWEQVHKEALERISSTNKSNGK